MTVQLQKATLIKCDIVCHTMQHNQQWRQNSRDLYGFNWDTGSDMWGSNRLQTT